MNEEFISEFIKEYTKIINEIKKKNNSEINKSLDLCLNNLTSLKGAIINKNNNLIEPLKLKITESYIEATNLIINLKYSKYFYNILFLFKKFLEYKLFSKEKSTEIIALLKIFYNNPKVNDDCIKKIMEIIQTFIFSEYFEIKYDSLSIIFIMILKAFNMTNHSKNKDFKNPIRLLFTTLTDRIYKSNNIQAILQTTKLIFSIYHLTLIENVTNKNLENLDEINEIIINEIIEILSKNKNNFFIRCLSLELLSQGFSDFDNNIKNNYDEINCFVKDKIINSLSININKIKNNYSISEDEFNYLNYLKICKFLKILLFNCNVNYDIIQILIEILKDEKNRQMKIFWKINLSFELLVQIISNYDLLSKIYLWKKEQLENIFSSLIKFLSKVNDINFSLNRNEIKKRDIYENKIYLEGDEIIVVKEEKEKYYLNLINQSIQKLIDSLMKYDYINKDAKIVDKEAFSVICHLLNGMIFKLFSNIFHKIKETNNITINESYNEIKMYINNIKNLISLYNNINNVSKKNEAIKFLCDLALDYSDKDKNDEINLFLALYLLELIKEINILNQDSYVILLQTIEVFNRKYNYLKLNEYIKKDIYKIINDMDIYLNPKNKKNKKKSKIRIKIKIKDENDENNKNEIIEKIEIQNGIKNLENKDEDNAGKNKLCKEINELFLDKKIYDFDTIKIIIEALCTCIDLSIQKMKNNKIENKNINNFNEENYNNFTFEINFYFSKILSLTLLYLDNIYILFDPFISVVNKLIDNKLMLEFSLDVLCALIPEILLKYKNIKSSINKNINEENKIWINEKWQKVLFSPLLTLLSQPELFVLLRQKIFISIEKIIQKSGNYIDSYGWDSIIQTCIILSNYNFENSFLIIKEILNNYKEYLSIFNVIPLMKLIKLFICEEKDKNVNFSSIELFWSCANIIDDFKQGKRKINENQKLYFIKNMIEKEIEIEKYCDDLYINLFSYLIEINTNSNIDIRKSILNNFTEIFVIKMKSINKDIYLKIIKDIFFKIFEINSSNYITDNKNSENEKILEISLLCIMKIMKEYLNENEKQNEIIYKKYLNKIIEIIPCGTKLLITDILKSLVEIKTSKNSNIPLIQTKNEAYFQILSLINIYLKSPNFLLDKNFKVPIYRLFKSILSYLSYIPNEDSYSDENIKILFDIIDILLTDICELESKLLVSKPSKLMDFENDIFIFLEKIKIQENFLFNYLFSKMNLDLKNSHSWAICKRSFESIHNLISAKLRNKKIFGINDEEKEIIFKYIEKVKNLLELRNNNEIIVFLFNSNIDSNIKNEIDLNKYLESFIKIINEICKNFFKIYEENNFNNEKERIEIINNIYEIFLLILDLFEMIFKQSLTGYQSINKSYHSILVNETFQKMDIISTNFIINKMLYYIQLIHGNETNEMYIKIEKKLMNLIKLISDISYDNNINNGDSTFISLNQYFINELFRLCKYKTNKEILNEVNHINIKINEDELIQNYIKTSKILTNLLIQKMIEILKKFREDEKKMGDMPLNRGRIYEIISLLNNVKNLEIYPDFNELKRSESDNKNEEIAIYDSISKSKKIHLFYIQPILNDFIFSKENSVKNLVKEIFNEITNIIHLPKLINFDE